MSHAAIAHSPLSAEQLQALFTDGYVILPGLLAAADVARVSDEMDRIYERGIAALPTDSDSLRMQVAVDGARVTGERQAADLPWQIRHVPQCGGLSAELAAMGRCEQFLALAHQVLATDDIVQIINQLHYKHPGSGVVFPWHQDGHHRGMQRGRFTDVNGHGSYLQIVTAIDASTQENGGLRFVRGIPESLLLPHDGAAIPDAYIDESAIVTPDLAPGDAVLFGPYSIHGSLENRSTRSRRVFINGFACRASITPTTPE